MKRNLSMVFGASLGAGLMYILDPDRGRRRRALVRDQLVRASHKAADALNATSSDLSNRTRGMGYELRGWFSSSQPSDEVLVERVRSAIGRVVRHPGSVDVWATDGRVVLSGPVLAEEAHNLINRVRAIRGVVHVEDRLEVHIDAAHVPGLQGEPTRRLGMQPELFQENWSPTARLFASTAGGIATLYGAARRGLGGTALGLGGLLLLARGATNKNLARLAGMGGHARGVDVQKTLRINAPIERVFELWSSFENFPNFMSHIKQVRKIDDKHSHWTVTGPAGADIEWDAVITRLEPNRALAWRTEGGVLVQHSGIVTFHSNADGTTTINIRTTYNPIAGAAGHSIAKLLGVDPKHQMDDDLMRMKGFVETHARPTGATAPTPRPL